MSQIFSQNGYLRKSGIHAWNIPAHFVEVDGQKFYTCPSAGVCGAFCYAKFGAYNFSNVKSVHMDRLLWVLRDPDGWQSAVNAELRKPKYRGKFIRVHDAGDFFSREYAERWFEIAWANPGINFYAYTKEVDLFKNQIFDLRPDNFVVIYSLGGKQDRLIDKEFDRHSDVFGSLEELESSGYVCVQHDDRLASTHPNHRIGLYRNNIKPVIKKMGQRKFSDYSK